MLPVHSLQTEFDRLYREMQALYHEAAVAVGLSDSGLTVMYAICELGEGCRQKDICQRCSSPKQTIHSAVRKLVEAGLVRTESGKGHELHLYLTPEGAALADRIVMLLVCAVKYKVPDIVPNEERTEAVREIRHYVSTLRKTLRGD